MTAPSSPVLPALPFALAAGRHALAPSCRIAPFARFATNTFFSRLRLRLLALPPNCPAVLPPALPGPVLPALPLAHAAGRRAPPCCLLPPVPRAACNKLTLRSPRARSAILGSPLSAHDWLTYTTASWQRRSPVQPASTLFSPFLATVAFHPGLQCPRLLRHRHPRSSAQSGLPLFLFSRAQGPSALPFHSLFTPPQYPRPLLGAKAATAALRGGEDYE